MQLAITVCMYSDQEAGYTASSGKVKHSAHAECSNYSNSNYENE